MSNIHDYVRWRGDLLLEDHPFNIVDNLVLTALSNIDLTDLVQAPGGAGTTVEDASQKLTARGQDALHSRRLVFVPPRLLIDMGQSARFRDAVLSAYVDVTDTSTGTQFSAVMIRIADGSTYVAFRGTDNSIVGWREDFTMSFEAMPSQAMAAAYLREALRSSTGPVRVGGHSKGGNLAVFAAMSLSDDERLRVTHVYDNDGPGLSRDIVDQPALAELAGKITKVVPEFTVIGRLFNNVPATHIVASNGRGLLQHDIMTWQVEGTALVERDAESARSALINRLVDAWLEEAAPEDRRDFTDALFSALGAGGATLVQDTARREHGSFESILFHLVRARSKTRRSVRTTMRVLGRSLAAVDYRALLQQRRALQAVVLISVGIVFIQAPALAIQVLGAFATLVVSVAVAVRLLGYLRRFRRTHNVRWPWVAAGVGLFVLLLYGLEHIEALVTPTNLLLGVVLIAAAISRTMDALHELHAPAPRHIRTVLLSLSAIVGVLMGIVALATAGRVLPLFVLEVGLFFLVTGLIEVFFALHDRVRRANVDASFMESAAHASRRGEPLDRPPRHGPSRPVRRP